MKRPLAYITAAWCGDPDTDMELAARYCRMAYEAGFSPICPILYLPLFINDAMKSSGAGCPMCSWNCLRWWRNDLRGAGLCGLHPASFFVSGSFGPTWRC